MNGDGRGDFALSDLGGAAAMDDPRVAAVVDEYLRELDAGRRPDKCSYVERHPELASAVAACLEGLDLVRNGLSSGRTHARQRASAAQDAAEYFAAPLGDFQIVREIARGGMGVVYEAVQLSLGRRVALKVLPFAATLDARQLQRFKNEAQAAALLHHTHIVPIHAVGCERGVHFYAMQLIDGQSLAIVIRQLREQEGRGADGAGSLSTASITQPASDKNAWRLSLPGEPLAASTANGPAQATVDAAGTVTAGARISDVAYVNRVARLMAQAADALEHAHQAGVVHRDIKPGNLLVDAAANLWITDFGLAQLQADRGLTRSGEFLGTFRYVSPEQTRGQRTLLDHRTDIYSLGATFYELLTLEPVFPGETHQELLYEILHDEPKRPREWNRGIPAEIETIVLKALAKDPLERYQTAADFGADLQRYLDNKPILAKKPTVLNRARKWLRRHPSVAVAAILFLATLAAASLVSNRMIAREQQKTKQALQRERERAVEAEHQYQLARQAVDSLFQISQEELTDQPDSGARRRTLEIVISFYQSFINQRQRPDDPELDELTRAQDEVKGILAELNAFQREIQLHLLARGPVREELGLSEAQEDEVLALLETWEEERQTFNWLMRDMSEEHRRSRILEANARHQEELAAVLDEQQLARFRQLGLQSQGIYAFKEPEVIESLALSSEQLAEIRRIERETFWRPFGPGRPGGGDRGRGRRNRSGEPSVGRFWQDRREALDRVLALLAPDQLARWRELTGPPFMRFGDSPFGPPAFDPPR